MPKSSPQPYVSQEDRLSGHILKWLPDKGFGFVKGIDGTEYFFHRSAVKGASPNIDHQIQESVPVTFRPSSSQKGPRAEDVELGL